MPDLTEKAADPVRFRQLMARWATGVTIVTAREGGRDRGLTVNAFLSVSLEPPRILVSIATDADALPSIRTSKSFAVSVLSATQRALSQRFASRIPAEEKFAGVGVHRGVTGAALLDGTLAVFECQVEQEIVAGDHVLVLGRVVGLGTGPDAPPLLFYRSGYGEAESADRIRLPGSRNPQ